MMALYNAIQQKPPVGSMILKEKNGALCSFIVNPIVSVVFLDAYTSKTYKHLETTKVLTLEMEFYKTTRQRLVLPFTRIVLSNGFCTVRIIVSIV